MPLTAPSPKPGPRRALFGRARELGELQGALEEVLNGRGGVLLATGEPGIGKTRLADELARSAAARGFAVHWGRAWEVGGAPSYWPFIQVLRNLCRSAEPKALEGWAREQGVELAGLLPEIRHLVPALSASFEVQGERFQLFDAIGSLLLVASMHAPQLVILDDLHAADLSSLRLLEFLVRGLRSSRILVFGTFRDAEARIAPDVGQALARIARDALVLPLERLGRHEVEDFVTDARGHAPSAAEVEAILKRSEGNPLFLHEFLRLGSATREPDGIREVVRARLSLLTTPVRELLEVAAVLGREFWIAPLGTAAKLSESEARALLAPAVDAGVIEPLEQTGRYRFTHVLLREGLYEDLPAPRRAELHRVAARELGARIGEPPLAELAHHLLQAVPTVPVGEAADTALRAASRATDLLAFEDACTVLERTLALLAPCSAEERRRCEVTLALGFAQTRSAEVERGRQTCRRAVELALELGDGELLARAVLALADEYTPGIRNRALIALLERTLELLPPGDGALRARCLAQLAAERQPELDTRGPIAIAREAIAIARRVGDATTLRATLSMAALALLVYGRPEERCTINEEVLRLSLAAGDKRRALRAHLLLWNDSSELGEPAAAAQHAREYEEIARQLGHTAFVWISSGFRAAKALWEGRFEEARQGYAEARERSHTDQTMGVTMAFLPIGLACATEQYQDSPELEARCRATFGAIGAAANDEVATLLGELLIATLHARAGDRKRTAAQLDSLRSHALFPGITEPLWLALLADAAHLLDDRTLAQRIYDALLPHEHRFFNLGPLGPNFEPPLGRQLGILARTCGRLDDAVAHLSEAEARMLGAGMRSHLARVRYELAQALLERAKSGDRERASSLLAEARTLAVELDQTALLSWLGQDGSSETQVSESRAAAAPVVAASFDLSREGDYWAVSYDGRTVRLRGSRGLDLLEQLVGTPGQEFHVLQLVSPEADRPYLGDNGALLDQDAIRTYRTRLLELRETLDEAEAMGDRGRTEQARREMEFLTEELSRAVGLGGRERRTGNAAERARTTIQKRLRSAIRRIEQELPELGRHFEQTIRTGTFCGYLPEGRPHKSRP